MYVYIYIHTCYLFIQAHSEMLQNIVEGGLVKGREVDPSNGIGLRLIADFYVGAFHNNPACWHSWLSYAKQLKHGKMRIGTACSGSDVVTKALEHLLQSLAAKDDKPAVVCEHIFSVENDLPKQKWIQRYISPTYLFTDLREFEGPVLKNPQNGSPLSPLALEVDVFIAGFSCKSISRENNSRDEKCIEDGTGSSGETFGWTMSLIEKVQPPVVILENVKAIHDKGKCRISGKKMPRSNLDYVQERLEQAGYSFTHSFVDTRHYLLPQRRGRVWIVAVKKEKADFNSKLWIDLMSGLKCSSARLPLDKFIDDTSVAPEDRKLSSLQQQVLVATSNHCFERSGLTDKEQLATSHYCLELKNSMARATEFSFEASTCIRPGSRPWLTWKNRCLSATEQLALQGIFEEDYPEMTKHFSRWILRSLAGNSFSASLPMAAILAMAASTNFDKDRPTKRDA